MTLRAGAVGALVLAAALAEADGAATRATLVLAPQRPRVDRLTRVEVTLRNDAGHVRFAQRAWIVADMSGHAMRPVVAELRRGGDDVDFVGELEFTMRGPWRVTLNVEGGSDVLWAPLDVEVLAADAEPGAARMGYTLNLREPVQSNVWPPGWVLAVAIALAAAMQGTAVFFARRRQAHLSCSDSRAVRR